MANGTAVFTTELSDGTDAALGYHAVTTTENWRVISDIEPRSVGAPLPNGWVALDWQHALAALNPGTGNAEVSSLNTPKTAPAGVQDILSMWNGYLWIRTSAGKDIVVAATGDRAPGISTGDTVLRVPEHAQGDWTMTKIDGGTFGHDTLILIRHPGESTNHDDVNVLAPAPTAD